MQFHYVKYLQGLEADHTFRTPPWTMWLLPAVVLAASGLVVWGLLSGFLDRLFWVSLAVLVPAFAIVMSVNFLPTLRSTNWVLKIRGNTLYIMLRNYRNDHCPDDKPVVVSFEMADIESIGRQEKRLSAPRGRKSKTIWTERQLEILLKEAVPQEFRDALTCELNRKPPLTGASRSKYYYPPPISCDENTIRILWNGRNDVVKPSIDRALETLSQFVNVHNREPIDVGSAEDLDENQFDDHILELCQAGNRIEAIKLLRRVRGYSLMEAKMFVDEL